MLIRLLFISLLFASTSSFAQFALNQLSFAPPPSDMSVTFLSNVFGNVDGVLSGTGSQMFGQMMSVFNSAVLALGSIVMFYTIIVGTMHTAHEGEFLGKKWSSIWIPVRASLGISLLAPKASGYCLIQIFIMWIVLQGVGAADKIWNTTLDYLNAGGKFVQTKGGGGSGEFDSAGILESTDEGKKFLPISTYQENPNYKGAIRILAGQVCMLGLQRVFEHYRSDFLDAGKNNPYSEPCGKSFSGYSQWQNFCTSEVPDFLNTVNTINVQQLNNSSQKVYQAPMPNFSSAAPAFYKSLNGVCGTIIWNDLSNLLSPDVDMAAQARDTFGLSDSQINTMKLTRAIAIQQMYSFLSNIAQQMVQNDPQLNPNIKSDPTHDASAIAVMQYGFAMKNAQTTCNALDPDCQTWGSNQVNSGVLFSGTEFHNAIDAYNNVMAPFLSALDQASDQQTAKDKRDFITESKRKGWIMAGSYYFQMVALSGSPSDSSNEQDLKSGLEGSKPYSFPSSCDSNPAPDTLCWFLNKVNEKMLPINKVQSLINGSKNLTAPNICPDTLTDNTYSQEGGYISPKESLNNIGCASTALGFVGNSYFLWRSAQDVTSKLQMPAWQVRFPEFTMGTFEISVPCLGVSLGFFSICLGRILLGGLISIVLDIFYAVLGVLRWFAELIMNLIFIIPATTIYMPLISNAFELITTQMDSPILTLANMGAEFIHQITTQFLNMLLIMYFMSFIPMIGVGVVVLILLVVLPFYGTLIALFLGFGFLTAYYIPLLPFIIFTFGAIAWLIAVIEAMVAGPIVALGITSPEGEGILGKSEHGFMILVNVFLRPSLMIIGYITAIIMTYVSVWVLSAGYAQAAQVLTVADFMDLAYSDNVFVQLFAKAFFVFIYINLYITVVQKSFNLISTLPDRILRWIGGSPEDYGAEAQRWEKDIEGKLGEFGKKMEEGSHETLKEAQKVSKLGSSGAAAARSGAGAAGGPGGVQGS